MVVRCPVPHGGIKSVGIEAVQCERRASSHGGLPPIHWAPQVPQKWSGSGQATAVQGEAHHVRHDGCTHKQTGAC